MKNDNYIMLPNGIIITREEYRESYARLQHWKCRGYLGASFTFKHKTQLHALQSQVYDKLTVEEREAYDQMWLGNFKGTIERLFADLSRGIPTALIEPTPLPELNKFIQEQVKLFRGE